MQSCLVECEYLWAKVVTEIFNSVVCAWRGTQTSVVKVFYLSVKLGGLSRLEHCYELEHETPDGYSEDVALDDESCEDEKNYLKKSKRSKCFYNRTYSPFQNPGTTYNN
jgi:hypothetical protein